MLKFRLRTYGAKIKFAKQLWNNDDFRCFNIIVAVRVVLQYLISDLDEQGEHGEHEQVVKDTDCSDDDVDDLDYQVMNANHRSQMMRERRRDVIPDVTR